MDIEIIWKKFHQPLKGFVSKRVSDQYIAEDIVQDVFLKIAKSHHTLKEDEKISSWIYNITRNTIIDYYRRKKTMGELPVDLVAENKENETLTKELSKCIRPFIKQLPDKYKEAILLTEINGMSQKDLSSHLGMSFSGAKSRVQRGRLKLKELLVACCHIKTDQYGNILDYYEADNDCKSSACESQSSVFKSDKSANI
ncbi:RNA polymerase sigma-70 factor, ECF subfamily [Gracilibacillus ureilyticus]|uniref:RNA polymerase sigma factor SigZ n=1 Tax=Gracilibacillus ureilyticus TaxID=531814 RepID=A0A1H9VQX7_9BACI|nr:RNA polymerase sigma factor SigZ [Gracilibacillus ureilyticus]SES23767.1 RNA polymerase sigma-70 factor, ECF subfamily [Gracilibacillus ureilyticus]